MDLRKQKTRRAIKQAFMQLRQERTLEQITVKELSELAQISKATFYLHYRDIYDLSECLQQEVIEKIITHMKSPLAEPENMSHFMRNLSEAFQQENPLISVLFSGSQAAALPIHLEAQLKKSIFEQAPHLKNNAKINVQLSYHIQGAYYAYMENVQTLGNTRVLDLIEEIQGQLPIMDLTSAQMQTAPG